MILPPEQSTKDDCEIKEKNPFVCGDDIHMDKSRKVASEEETRTSRRSRDTHLTQIQLKLDNVGKDDICADTLEDDQVLHQTYVKDIFIEVQTNQLTEQFLPYQKLIKKQERKLDVTSRLEKEMGNNLVLPDSLSTDYFMIIEKTNSLFQQLLTEHTKLDKVNMDLEEEFTEIQSANKVAYELWYPALLLK